MTGPRAFDPSGTSPEVTRRDKSPGDEWPEVLGITEYLLIARALLVLALSRSL